MEDVNRPFVEKSIRPRRVTDPGYVPGPAYRPLFRVFPCADVLECRCLNVTDSRDPAPTACERCGGPLLALARLGLPRKEETP